MTIIGFIFAVYFEFFVAVCADGSDLFGTFGYSVTGQRCIVTLSVHCADESCQAQDVAEQWRAIYPQCSSLPLGQRPIAISQDADE